ncbi:MAG TPA: SUMF1/EgtB/PvdO family nonheme iron enzyme [Planctomycetota bacterium]|nr:SUMF1/EgtB/PvdO family nonheme iron enzyme [Planctomycetota bacterium]
MADDGTGSPEGMVLVAAGPFLFGREKRTVTLGAFWIDRDPVTNRAYLAFVEATERGRPTYWPIGTLPEALLDHPVVCVTFEDAQAYARWAGKDLPTPAQWEKAARGADGRKFPWGSGFDTHRTNTKESAQGKTVPVTKLRDESPYGCRGMAGNVLEWTRGIADPKEGKRVVKGCSFRTYLGAASWSYDMAESASNDALGFRCVKPVASAVREPAAGEVAGPG